jgi:selenocysteine-specific elongation factor
VTVVLGTAGHIDHGKTALLQALTGMDPDRLPEERRRGMTIEVGYAHLRLADGSELDFVDVPGHDRLVGNMLVGAGEIDGAILVIAADDGPRAQTLEHLALLDGLGIHDGVVAISKVDLVESARLAEVAEQVEAILAGTTLEGSPIVAVSSIDGRGLDELGASLSELRDRIERRRGSAAAGTGRSVAAPVRLAIDRVFVIRGRGTVVTGSLRGGRLGRADQLRLVPGDRHLRARELQVHGASVEAVADGGRVALNLAGVEAAGLHRGDVLTTDPLVVASSSVLAVLRRAHSRAGTPDAAAWPPHPGSRFRFHLGTGQVEAAFGRGRRDLLALADGRLVARLRLAGPIAASDGDPFVLRRGSSGGPVFGGTVLDARPPSGPSRRRVDPERLAALASDDAREAALARVAIHGVLEPHRAAGPNLEVGIAGPGAGEPTEPVRLAGWLVDHALGKALESQALAAASGRPDDPGGSRASSRAEVRATLVVSLRRAASVEPGQAGLIADAVVAGLLAAGRLAQTGDRLHPPGQEIGPGPTVVAAMARLERLLTTAAPPSLTLAARDAACPAEGIRALESTGRIVRLDDDLAYAASSYAGLARAAVRMAGERPLSPAAFRDATGTSRRYVLAILEDLDRRGILRRSDAGHVPGPRASQVALLGPAGP